MFTTSRVLAGLPALLLVPALLSAQTSEPVAVKPTYTPPPELVDTAAAAEPEPEAPRRPGCWRAQPRPFCDGYFLTDIGVELPVYSTRRSPGAGRELDFPFRLSWTFGFMGTRGRHSHGGAVTFLAETQSMQTVMVPWFVEYRYRNWLGSSALDAGIGLRKGPVISPAGDVVGARGITAMVGYTPNRWIGATVRTDLLRNAGRTHTGVMLGLQSTRVSEFMIRNVFVAIVRELFASIGIEFETED